MDRLTKFLEDYENWPIEFAELRYEKRSGLRLTQVSLGLHFSSVASRLLLETRFES